MKKLDETKTRNKGNNLAHLVSLAAIIALLIVLMIVLFIKTAVGRKAEETVASIDFTEGLEGARREDVEVRLEEVQKYLKTLESAVNDSTTTLNTLYDNRNEEEQAKLNESATKLTSIEERLSKVNIDVTELLKEISANEKTDIDVILEKFSKTSEEIEKLGSETGKIIDELKKTAETNKSEMADEITKIETSLNESTKKTEASMTESLNKITSSLNDSINKTNNSLTDAINKGNTSLTDAITKSNTSVGEMILQSNNSVGELISQGNTSLSDKIAQGNSRVSEEINSSNENLSGKIQLLSENISSSLTQGNEGIMGFLNEFGASVNERFNRIDTDIEQVFQYVTNGKLKIASALVTIGDREAEDAEDGQLVQSFDELASKIEHSQDISGTYDSDGETRDLSGAIENNLPIGVGAWVRGHFVVGNGADIRASFEKGYSDGFADGLAQGLSREAHIEYIYHQHVDADGNPTDSTVINGYGGCFVAAETTTVQVPCGGTVSASWHDPDYYWTNGHWSGTCNRCGAKQVTGGPSGSCGMTRTENQATGRYVIGCGKSTSTIESAVVTFD